MPLFATTPDNKNKDNNNITPDIDLHHDVEMDENDAWSASMAAASTSETIATTSKENQYVSSILTSSQALNGLVEGINPYATTTTASSTEYEEYDALWEKVSLEATAALVKDPASGPQLYQGVLSQPSLLESIITVVSHEIATELIPATELKILFFEMLTQEDDQLIRSDLIAAATRCASVEGGMNAILFQQGFHALVCYRLGHRLWNANRTGLAYYMQSTVSRRYSADIHPAARLGFGIHLRTAAGVVIGETAVVGNDTTILQGVTLGGTGKEAGDRHPKVGCGVTIMNSVAVLGNIRVEDGSVILAKSIVTKPVPPLAVISGVPGKIQSYRDLNHGDDDNANMYEKLDFLDDYHQRHLIKYLDRWKEFEKERLLEAEQAAKAEEEREKATAKTETTKKKKKKVVPPPTKQQQQQHKIEMPKPQQDNNNPGPFSI